MLQMLSPLDLHTLETAWTWGVATFATPHVLYSVLGAGVCWLVWRLFLHRAEQPPPPLWQSAPNGYNEVHSQSRIARSLVLARCSGSHRSIASDVTFVHSFVRSLARHS